MGGKIEGTTVHLIQGDSVTIPYDGLEPNTLVYFGVRDKKNNPVFEELYKIVDEDGYVDFKITKEMSDLLKVKSSEKYTDYYHGLKKVDKENDTEDTIFLGLNPKFDDRYILRVYPKKVEGL